jgi:hypothetical protein
MSQTELLLKKVEGLSPDYMAQIFDFIDQLTHKAPPAGETAPKSAGNTPATSRAERLLGALSSAGDISLDEIKAERLGKYL